MKLSDLPEIPKLVRTLGAVAAVFVAGSFFGGYIAVPNKLDEHEERIAAQEARTEEHERRATIRFGEIDRRLDRITCLMEEDQRSRPDPQRCALMRHPQSYGGGER